MKKYTVSTIFVLIPILIFSMEKELLVNGATNDIYDRNLFKSVLKLQDLVEKIKKELGNPNLSVADLPEPAYGSTEKGLLLVTHNDGEIKNFLTPWGALNLGGADSSFYNKTIKQELLKYLRVEFKRKETEFINSKLAIRKKYSILEIDGTILFRAREEEDNEEDRPNEVEKKSQQWKKLGIECKNELLGVIKVNLANNEEAKEALKELEKRYLK